MVRLAVPESAGSLGHSGYCAVAVGCVQVHSEEMRPLRCGFRWARSPAHAPKASRYEVRLCFPTSRL